MEGRQLPRRDYLALKAATRRLVEECGGATAVARGPSRVFAKSTIHKYGAVNGEGETVFAPIDVIADLEAEIGSPEVTRALAEIAGFVLVPAPQAEPGRKTWIAHLSSLGATESDIRQILLRGASGPLSTDDADQLKALCRLAMEKYAAIAADLRGEADAE